MSATAYRPDRKSRDEGIFAYPELRIDYAGKLRRGRMFRRAFARLNQPGTYATSIARPELFRDYLVEQLEHLARDYEVDDLGRPLGKRDPLSLCDREQRHRGRRRRHGRAVALLPVERAGPYRRRDRRRRLEQRSAGDCGRWRCSTGRGPTSAWRGSSTTPARRAEHFQHFVLFTNYVRYVDEFVGFAIDALRRKDSALHRAVGARRASTSRAS